MAPHRLGEAERGCHFADLQVPVDGAKATDNDIADNRDDDDCVDNVDHDDVDDCEMKPDTDDWQETCDTVLTCSIRFAW